MRAAFDRFDKNRSGFLDYRELRNALQHMGYDVSTRDAMELLRAYDDYPDGKLDVHEFGKLVRDLGAALGDALAFVGLRNPAVRPRLSRQRPNLSLQPLYSVALRGE